MGLLSALGDFLFGKSPEIFDNSGRVSHKLTKRTWDAWSNRIKMDPKYNWRNHTGTKAGSQANNHQPANPNTTSNK